MVMIIFIIVIINLILAGYYIRRKLERDNIYTIGDIHDIHLKALNGKVFYIDNRQAMFLMNRDTLYKFDETCNIWVISPENFTNKNLLFNKYDVKIINHEILNEKYFTDPLNRIQCTK